MSRSGLYSGFLSLLLSRCLLAQNTLHIVLILPLRNGGNITQEQACVSNAWERGDELLAAAERAVESINQDPNILQGYRVELRVVNSDSCYQAESMLPSFVETSIYRNHDVISTVGMFCPGSAQVVTSLIQTRPNRLHSPFIVGSTAPRISKAPLPSNVLYMFDSTLAIARAVVKLMEYQKWTRLAVITDLRETVYLQTAQAFIQLISTHPNITISSTIQVHKDMHFRGPSLRSDPRVVFVSASLDISREIYRTASQMDRVWPSHAWILHTHTLEELTGERDCAPQHLPGGKHGTIHFDGVFLLQNSLLETKIHRTENSESDMCFSNPHACVLRETIMMSALIKNLTLSDSNTDWTEAMRRLVASGVVRGLEFNDSTRTLFSAGVDITQVIQGRPITVAHYDRKSGNLTIFNSSISSNDVPLSRVYRSKSVFLLMCFYADIIGCLALVSVNLFLYVYFRKEPEVKATSFPISIIVFVSCYLSILYMVLLTLAEHFVKPTKFASAVCLARSWLNLLGLPGSLFEATLLMKMLRVYRIFDPNNLTRTGKNLSNSALVCYILLLQLPSLLVTILWSSIDPYLNVITETQLTNSVKVVHGCFSEYLKVWPLLLLCYHILLLVSLGITTFKTRHIRKAHFNDSDRVNTFVFLMISLTLYILIGWLIFRAFGENINGRFMLHVGHTLIVVVIQTLLFTPKVFPLLKRRITRWRQEQKGNHTITGTSSVMSLSSARTQDTGM